jgi:hypothetical protein
MIRRLTLHTQANKNIVDIPNFQYFWGMTAAAALNAEQFVDEPIAAGCAAGGVAGEFGFLKFLNPTNTNAAIAAATTPNGVYPTIAADGGAPNNTVGACRKIPFAENYFVSSAANGAGTFAMEIDLGKIPFSFFNVNRDFYSVETLQLTIEWEGYDSFLFQATFPPAGGPPIAFANIATLVGVPTFTSMALYMAVEMNESVRNSVISKVTGAGLTLLMPYSFVYVQGIGQATNYAVNYKINRAHGERLLRCITAPVCTTANTLANRALTFNIGANNITTYNTQLDSRRLQVEDLSCAVGTNHDFLYNYPLLKNSIYSNLTDYAAINPIHIDDWSAIDTLDQAAELDLTACGLPLDTEKLYTFNILARPNTFNIALVTVVVTQRTITSGPSGILV